MTEKHFKDTKEGLEMKGKYFKDIWEELEDYPFDEDEDCQMRMSYDFYDIPKGSTPEEIWMHFESVFPGLIIGEVINNCENWEDNYGYIVCEP